MPIKPCAVALNFLVPRVAEGRDLIITEMNQPYACAASDLLVGLHGLSSQHALRSVFRHVTAYDSSWRQVKVLVRPKADPIATRRHGDGLRGMPFFDAERSPVAVKTMMGEAYRKAAETGAARDGLVFDASGDVDWNDPRSYMCRFPHAATEVFRMLPDLEVMIAFVEVEGQVMRVALVPIAKLGKLAEWGDDAVHDERIKVRCVRNGTTTDIRLPPKTLTVPAALQSLVGYDRYKRGEHPLRRKATPPTGASPSL